MKKYFPHISAFIPTVLIIFAVSGFGFPKTVLANGLPGDMSGISTIIGSLFNIGGDAFIAPFGWIAQLLLKIASLLTYLSGSILNYVVQFTIVDMKTHIEKAEAINTAWKAIRDIANMGFIFVLLYAAIRTILSIENGAQKLIVNIIVIAILINFSLFFTKVVIDASNILAITFYDAIAPEALRSDLSLGLSGKLMDSMSITSLWKANIGAFDGTRLIVIGIMGAIVALIAAFVFFAIALMFVIRFVVLIFVLILSPLAFAAVVLPALQPQAKKWKDALIGQAFFAPIYFLLTWIVMVVSSSLFTKTGDSLADAFVGVVSQNGDAVEKPPPGSIAILVNFIIVIVLLIASLIIAKDWANKAGPGVAGLTKWAMGAAGGATLGMGGRFGRNTAGAAASRLSQSEGFQQWAGRSIIGQTLYKGTGRAAKSSFDLRATKVGGAALGQLDAGQAQKGGFEARVQRKTEAREEFAQSLKSPAAKEAYAQRISRGPLTSGGTRSSRNTIFGTLGRHNRVAASKILNSQLSPLETQEQNLQNRENQLTQQLSSMNNELATINAAVAAGTATPQQIARQTALNGPVTNRNSIAYISDQLTTTQTRLANVTTETGRIRAIIAGNQLTNPARPVVNPVTGTSRDTRADEQNY